MKVWKVILAALVIFAAGVVTGGLTVRLKFQGVPAPATTVTLGPIRQRGDLLDRLQRQLYLSPPQRERIEVILRENHDRMKQLWDSIAPQAQEEHRRVHDRIRAELNPEQQKKYEEIFKARNSKAQNDDRRRKDERRDPKSPRRVESATSTNPAPVQREREAR